MEKPSLSEAEARNLRFLRILVTALTTTMILGLLAIVTLLVIRFGSSESAIALPDQIELPSGARASAFTQGQNWLAVVTTDDRILIYSADGKTMLHEIDVKAAQ
jgi:hypothetical protein